MVLVVDNRRKGRRGEGEEREDGAVKGTKEERGGGREVYLKLKYTSCVQDTQYAVAIVVRQVEVVSGPMPCLTELVAASGLVAMAVDGAIPG